MYHRVDAKYNVRRRKIENKIQRPLVRYKFVLILRSVKRRTYMKEKYNCSLFLLYLKMIHGFLNPL